MDIHRNTLLTWAYYCQGKSMEELRQSLLVTTMELETTRIKAQEELKMREDQMNYLKHLLTETIRERDEAQDKCQRILLDKLLLQQNHHHHPAPRSGVSSIDDDHEPRRGLDSSNGFSSSDCEESIVSSPVNDPVLPAPAAQLQQPPMEEEDEEEELVTAQLISADKPLPEKGKLLQAVMKAGPLLQNLLLAGPLPQWRHPPPPIDTYQIPPPPVVAPPPPPPPQLLLRQDSVVNKSCEDDQLNVDLCGRMNRKRGVQYDSSASDSPNKYQKVVVH